MRAFHGVRAEAPELVAAWVARMQGVEPQTFGKNYRTLAFFDERGMKLAVVYNAFTGTNVSIHFAARKGALWAHHETLNIIYNYAYGTMGCKRVTAPILSTNKAAIAAALAVGYKLEGVLRQMDKSGADLHIYGMLKEECRWLNLRRPDAQFA